MLLGNYEYLWLLWLVPILAGLYALAFYRKGRALRLFAAGELLGAINPNVGRLRQIVKACLLLLAVLGIVVGLARPKWNPQPQKIEPKGRDLVVLLDVSRSMLAEDLRPNRLAQAKLAVGDLLDVLAGDRIGIVAFAGTAVLKCPLTQDYGFARMVLAELDCDSISRGGTVIGDAIRTASDEVFDSTDRDFKDIILITDGEDHESFPIEAAEKAAAKGVRIFAIGLGDETEGARIPQDALAGSSQFVQYQGEDHLSRLDGELLRQIVYATAGGRYLNVATGTFDLAELYNEHIVPSGKRLLAAKTKIEYDERFGIFLAMALFFLILEAAISERKRVLV